ncbi:Alpha/Beta hydrolase protein [Fennellomyces sp. T-0311]|nr:Alpha/Beta hydrolase protein [Fennellomyces sp. T-0311]
MVKVEPYGAWTSPVAADSLSAGVSGTDVCIDRGIVYWCEIMPSEGGRGQIFSCDPEGNIKPLLPEGYSCRTRVHEYGGGSFTVRNGIVVFSNDEDSRLYVIDGNEIKPLTRAPGSNPHFVDTHYTEQRFADPQISADGTYLFALLEGHLDKGQVPENRVVHISMLDGDVHNVASGSDFYGSPRLWKNKFAYLSWENPNMPWDYTNMTVGTISSRDSTGLVDVKRVPTVDESFVQPEFGADGTLYVASDRSGYWNLYRYNYETESLELLLSEYLSQEFAGPSWRLNESYYKPFVSDPNKLVCSYKNKLSILDTKARTLTDIEALSHYVSFNNIRTYYDDELGEVIVANATSATAPCELIAYSQGNVRVLRPSTALPLDTAFVSVAEEIEFPTTDQRTAYAFFYPPKNPDYVGPDGEKPPLRVLSHGGPTANANAGYARSIQYWTTRGFAIVDVNYGGSTGYGREYRNRLKKKWGIVDVDDCCNAALYLAEQGLVDGEKLTIEGGSAGGYTTLACLAFRDVFKAGCCQYGISDLAVLRNDTHKFELHYPEQLIGKWPEDEQVYKDRSPLFSAENIKCPVIFFQGSEDKVVPPIQTAVIFKALNDNGVPVASVLYAGEAHGFRKAENIKRTVELEHWFYGQIFGFPVEGVEGVKIYNFSK